MEADSPLGQSGDWDLLLPSAQGAWVCMCVCVAVWIFPFCFMNQLQGWLYILVYSNKKHARHLGFLGMGQRFSD